jgi:hypothetical protein
MMLGEISIEITINDCKYKITESLSKESFVISDRAVAIDSDIYNQLRRMLKRICKQCFDDKIHDKIK